MKPIEQLYPKGLVPRATTDNLGRVTKQVENYTNGTVTDTSNKTTEFTYNAVGRTTVKVVLPSSGQQVTEWVYGVTTGSGSTLNSNDLVKEVRYPDATTGASRTTDKNTITTTHWGKPRPSPPETEAHLRTCPKSRKQSADGLLSYESDYPTQVKKRAKIRWISLWPRS